MMTWFLIITTVLIACLVKTKNDTLFPGRYRTIMNIDVNYIVAESIATLSEIVKLCQPSLIYTSRTDTMHFTLCKRGPCLIFQGNHVTAEHTACVQLKHALARLQHRKLPGNRESVDIGIITYYYYF